jgi:hypothetical protein
MSSSLSEYAIAVIAHATMASGSDNGRKIAMHSAGILR